MAASYGGTVRRPSATSATASMADHQENDSKGSAEKALVCSFDFIWPFSIPSTSGAAGSRIIRNLNSFFLYYIQFIFIVLLITLIPRRKVSLVYLVIMKEITFMYLFLLHALPNSALLHKNIDKRFVLFMLSLIAANMLILTGAAIHLFASLGGTIPLVLVHAVFWTSEKGPAADAEEMVRLVGDEDGDTTKPLDVV